MKAIDPVCGMSVNTEKAWGSLEHEGTVYYFCAAHCAKVFAEHPGSYVTKSRGVGGHDHHHKEKVVRGHHGGGCCHH